MEKALFYFEEWNTLLLEITGTAYLLLYNHFMGSIGSKLMLK